MRDFNSGDGDIHVAGDINIADHSTAYVPFDQCPSELLKTQELPLRLKNVASEQKATIKRLSFFYWAAASGFIFSAGWGLIHNNADLITFCFGVPSILLGAKTLLLTLEPNKFQQLQQQEIAKIKYILKVRGDE